MDIRVVDGDDPDKGITAFCNSGLKEKESKDYPYNADISLMKASFENYMTGDEDVTDEEKASAWHDYAAGWRACLEKIRSRLHDLD